MRPYLPKDTIQHFFYLIIITLNRGKSNEKSTNPERYTGKEIHPYREDKA